MAIRFKFRSSVAFDTIDIDSRSSISVRDLRSKIADRKKLQICGDFDLVLSDADTGQAFEDEDFQIPASANVVIKRVPRGREASHDRAVIPDTTGKSRGYVGTAPITRSENVGIQNFDDFGVDVYPNLEASIHHFVDDIDQLNSTYSQEDAAIRFSKVPNLSGQNIEKGYVSQALSNEVTAENFRGELDKEENPKEMNLGDNGDPKNKHCEAIPFQLILNADLPAELRCSLCNTIFEEAVMIPCCQHSFCNKCITLTLAKQSSCPKCSSTKCTAKDLLPNLSLRQAIEHFLEAQNAINISCNNFPRYAPDGESGIQAKDVSCAVSVQQQEPGTCSPSTTVMGSNHVISEPASECGRVVIPPFKYRKYERNCYMCGSPDHLIRDCPHSKRGHSVVSGGIPPYREGYWHGAPLSNVPYANIYGTPSIMSFDPMMYRIAPFGIPSCLPPMYGNPSTPYGYMGMGAVPPLVMSGLESGAYAGNKNSQGGERKQKNELQERYHDSGLSEDYFSSGTRRSHEQPSQPDKGTSSEDDERWVHKNPSHHNPNPRPSYPVDKDNLVNVKHKEHHISACGRDRRNHYSEKSRSDLLDISEGSRRYSGEKNSHQYRSSKHSGSDCSYNKSHHKSRISDDDDFATHPERQSYKHYNHSESGLEPKSSSGPRKFHRERESSHSSRHSSKIVKNRDAPLDDDTWKRKNKESHHYHKYRRIR